MILFRQIIALLAFGSVLSCQQAVAQQPTVRRLRIIPLEGHNVVNYIPLRTATAPVIEVRDENDRPVEGVNVTFKLPETGAGANLGVGKTTYSTFTDFRGQAGVPDYTVNDQPGRFIIEITATHQDRTDRFLMVQTNSLDQIPSDAGGPRRSSRNKWLLLGAAAAGGSLGLYFGLRGGSSPISISAGPVVFGGPR